MPLRSSVYVKRSIKRLLVHLCDYIRKQATLVVDGDGNPILDEWDQYQYVDKEIVEEIKCLFVWKDVINITQNGDVLTRIPTLFLEESVPVSEGDVVSNIRTKGERLLMANARIETINMEAGLSEPVIKLCTLKGAVI